MVALGAKKKCFEEVGMVSVAPWHFKDTQITYNGAYYCIALDVKIESDNKSSVHQISCDDKRNVN
jgi:hypothetical protein